MEGNEVPLEPAEPPADPVLVHRHVGIIATCQLICHSFVTEWPSFSRRATLPPIAVVQFAVVYAVTALQWWLKIADAIVG
jgi:hypothetical protein